jgi:hypothetical protein
LNACERLTLPPARTLKRFAAPLFVFIFGITMLLFYYDAGCFLSGTLFKTRQSLGFLSTHIRAGFASLVLQLDLRQLRQVTFWPRNHKSLL